MEQLREFMPFIVPLIVVELGLLVYVIHHILTHKQYKHGNRTMWLIIVIIGMNFIGPILYFALGKEEV